jgi:two-component system sensor histidine kinase CiaH
MMTENKHIRGFMQSATLRLASTYLALIMVMSLSFSFVFYQTSSRQLGRQTPPPDSYEESRQVATTKGDILREYYQQRVEEGRRELLLKLIVLNGAALIVSIGVSYILARKTLQPIEDVMDAQNRFVSDASHELRTPLTALQTSNEVALRQSTMTKDETKELLVQNIEEVTKLKTLTEGLLGLLRQEDHSVATEPVSLQSAVTTALNRVIPAALSKSISVEDKVADHQVLSDEATLSQIITILLDNAVKYSPEDTTVTINSKIKGKHAILSITDQGIGIKASDIPHIFDRFYRADLSRNKHSAEGYGLGLSIAKKLSGQIRCRVVVASTVDKGSTFSIILPLY